jgi:hypothetical protein
MYTLTSLSLQPTLPQLAEAIASKDTDAIQAWAVANPFWSTVKLLARESGRRGCRLSWFPDSEWKRSMGMSCLHVVERRTEDSVLSVWCN